MKILIISELAGVSKEIETNFVPRVGDHVDLFYSPPSCVKRVLAFPSGDTLNTLGFSDIEAIVFVD
jgi:hypothetical protein